MPYHVQELTAGRWFTVRTFATLPEAKTFAQWLGHKTRILEA